jgi:hypothetical protein
MLGAPGGEQTQIGGVAREGVAGVAGQEPGDRRPLNELDRIVVADEHRGCG